jgi:hypothetical protein
VVRIGGPLYRRHCQRCHGADGEGDREQISSDGCPDFSSRAWQEQRSDARLLASVLKGTEGGMPAFRRLSEAQARAVVSYVRRFALRRQKMPTYPPATPTTPTPHRREWKHQRRGIGCVIRGLGVPSLTDAISLLDASNCVRCQSQFQAVLFPKWKMHWKLQPRSLRPTGSCARPRPSPVRAQPCRYEDSPIPGSARYLFMAPGGCLEVFSPRDVRVNSAATERDAGSRCFKRERMSIQAVLSPRL